MPLGVYEGSKAHAIDDEPCATNNKVTNNMRPKGKLFALLAIFAAIGLVTATGAFTTVQAERTVNVDVTGDANALLALQSESQYATTNNAGELLIDFSSDTLDAQGLNQNATTQVDRLFNVTNNGDEEVGLFLSDDSSAISFYNTTSGPGSSANVSLGAGSTAAVGIEIVTVDQNIDATLTINATTRATPP